jgi:hypothetical protein
MRVSERVKSDEPRNRGDTARSREAANGEVRLNRREIENPEDGLNDTGIEN